MIKVQIYRNANRAIYGFDVSDHADPLVCSAVTTLAIGAVNSIEALTEEEMILEHNPEEEGGFLSLRLPDIESGTNNHDANLLLESFLIGLLPMAEDYPLDLEIIDEEVS